MLNNYFSTEIPQICQDILIGCIASLLFCFAMIFIADSSKNEKMMTSILITGGIIFVLMIITVIISFIL